MTSDSLCFEPGSGADDSSESKQSRIARPVLPLPLQKGHRRDTVATAVRSTAYGAIRAPMPAVWALKGIGRLVWIQLKWAWLDESRNLRHAAANENKYKEWYTLHRHTQQTRSTRFIVLGIEAALVVIALAVVYSHGPWAKLLATALLCIPFAIAERSRGRAKTKTSTASPRKRWTMTDLEEAFVECGISKINPKDSTKDKKARFPQGRIKTKNGVLIPVEMPPGKTIVDVIDAKQRIASCMDIVATQIYPSRDPVSDRRVTLWIADKDPLADSAGINPLCVNPAEQDIWQPVSLGLDERGVTASVPALWNSFLIGAVQRWGKTVMAKNFAITAALDPFVRLIILDGSPKPDWRIYEDIAESSVFGSVPVGDDDPRARALEVLQDLKADTVARYQSITHGSFAMSGGELPEYKLTRDLARDLNHDFRIVVLVLEEIQEFFNTGVRDIDDEIADLLLWLIRVGPAAGIILVTATQRPSGVGSTSVKQKFTAFRDLHGGRLAGRVPNSEWSDFILGNGSVAAGLNAKQFNPGHEGSFLANGIAGLRTPIVRAWNSDLIHERNVVMAAKELRVKAGTYKGHKAVDLSKISRRELLPDVLAAMGDRSAMSWVRLAERLQSAYPTTYAALTGTELSRKVRERAPSVTSIRVREGNDTPRGVRRSDLESALKTV